MRKIAIFVLLAILAIAQVPRNELMECLSQYESDFIPSSAWETTSYEIIRFVGYQDGYHWDLPGVTDSNWRQVMKARYMYPIGDQGYGVVFESALYPDSVFLFAVDGKTHHGYCDGFRLNRREAWDIICQYEPRAFGCH